MSVRQKTEVREFNQGLTTMHLEFSIPNNAWFVWRDDSGYVPKGLLKIHQHYKDAKKDFDDRCAFLETVQFPGRSKGALELIARKKKGGAS